ncbi:MAG: purine-nucleoside phosphorylase [Balneolales bacterium]
MLAESIVESRTRRKEALAYIQAQTKCRPEYLIILGTGLGQLANQMEVQATLSYADIPCFPVSTVESHAGRLVFGKLGGKHIVAMQGRFHRYEGYTMQQIVFPLRVLKMNGAHTLLISNAGGGMNPHFRKGDIMCIVDHINLLGDNPLTGPNDDELGIRFPDMSEPYCRDLIGHAENAALENGIRMHQGVYTSVAGPMLETRAEYRYLRNIGTDVVGMSTIPEVIAAVHMNMKVLGISAITDECFPDTLKKVNIKDILEAADLAEPNMTKIMTRVLERI